MPAAKHTICPDNAFSYSLPVTSRMIVNQVDYNYTVLERIIEQQERISPITVRLRDCSSESVGNNRHRVMANVRLDRVWERITNITITPMNVSTTKILTESSVNILRIEFEADIRAIDRFEVHIS